MTRIICDSGPLISFSDTCLVNVLKFLKQRGAEFVIPGSVQREIVETPLKIRRYAFSAVRLHKSIDDGDLKLVNPNENTINQIASAANSIFSVRGNTLKILHAGEAACLAAYKQFKCDALAIDEKTTRLLIEDPALLQEKMFEEYGSKVVMNKKSLDAFAMLTSGISIIRSTELLAVAAKRGYFNSFGEHKDQAFYTAIYALKQAGCSISEKEVSDYQKLKF